MLFPDFHYFGFKTAVDMKTRIYSHKDPTLVLPVGEEAYASVYRFNEAVANLDSLANLPKGIEVYPDFIPFDFDSKDDLRLALADAHTLCKRLQAIQASFQFFFSGGKGFHVHLPSSALALVPTSDVNGIKFFAETLARDLKTFDPSIYNLSRIFRCEGSYNKGGGAVKVLLAKDFVLEDFNSYLAELYLTEPFFREIYIRPSTEPSPPVDPLVTLYKKITQKENNNTPSVRVQSEQDPKHHGSLFAKADEGKRNETAYTVARRLARRGIPLEDARKVMATVWNGDACQPPLPVGELLKVVENAYSKGVNEFVDEGNYQNQIINIKGGLECVSKRFQTQQGGFLTGYEMLDKFTMGFQPEELIWITGRSGNFKSTILTHFLQRGSKLARKPALYFSMEMGQDTLIPRMIQQAEGIRKKDAVKRLREGAPLTTFTKTMEDFEFVKFIYLSNLTTEQVLGLIDYHIETYGELSAVGFDYLSLFKGANNNTERTAKQAQELKTLICKAAKAPVFCLTQAKQIYEGREGDIELDRSCPKDSDSILDLGDYAIGTWGHWQYNPEKGVEEKYQFGKFFKARGMDDEAFGERPYFGLAFDKPYMRLNDIIYIKNPEAFNFKQLKGDRE